jgi:amino acid transporter
MGFIIALFVVPFVTLPSIVYSISYFALGFLITYIVVLYNLAIGRRSTFLRLRCAIIGDRITSKVVPIFLIIVVPIILYFYTWKLAGWIFFAWMIIYFLSRRFSGVSRWHMQVIQQRKKAEKTLDRIEEQINDRNQLKNKSMKQEPKDGN